MQAVVVGPAYPRDFRARVEVPSRSAVERIARRTGVPLLENPTVWFCVVDGTVYAARKKKRRGGNV